MNNTPISQPAEPVFDARWKQDVKEWAERKLEQSESKKKSVEKDTQKAYFNGQSSAWIRLIQCLSTFDD